MNPPTINSTTSVSTTRRKREAERSVNWTLEETQVLLCAWSDERVQKSLAENLRNRHVFKHLSARMSEMGFCRSPHQCRLRVKTLKANYVRAKLQRSVDGSQPCTFKYFTEMDAVLGRRADGGGGGAYWTGEPHLNSTSRTGSTPPDLNCSAEVSGRQDACSGRRRLSWSEERGGAQSWLLDSEVKVEDGDVSTDEFEFSNPGRPQQDGAEGHLGDTCGSLIQNHLSSPLHLVPPPLVQSVSPPPPAPPDPLPSSDQQHPESTCLEPVLRHLSQCFQALVSETRGLLVQLESQRQEQARWHQELLAQWLQREEQRQRETAEREERRERARMEHEIRVLELLGGLAKTHSCERGGGLSHCGDRDGD